MPEPLRPGNGWLHKADTLEALAIAIGIPGREHRTVNGFADSGRDLDLTRGSTLNDLHYTDPRITPNPSLGVCVREQTSAGYAINTRVDNTRVDNAGLVVPGLCTGGLPANDTWRIEVEFGLLYEWQMPAGVSRADESRHFLNMMEQIRLAEELGFTSVWSVEHHFLENFSHASAPEVLLSWIAAQTKTIRVGHGVRLLPYPYNHPIRAAEQAATLDLLSQGRLEFGTGRSATAAELGGFGIDPAETRDMWRESLELILKAWRNPIVEHDGKYFNQVARPMVPKPLQSPHPPLWMSCTSPESHEVAGALGLGLLSFTLALAFEEVASRIAMYRQRIKTATPIGDYVNNQTAVFTMAHCAATAELARLRAEAGVMRYQHDQIALLTSLIPELKENSSYDYYGRFVGVDYDKFTYDYLDSRNMILVGDPERCIHLAKQYEAIGVDRLLLFVQYADMPHEHTMDSLRLFGTEVLPAFS